MIRDDKQMREVERLVGVLKGVDRDILQETVGQLGGVISFGPGQQVKVFTKIVFEDGCWDGPKADGNCELYKPTKIVPATVDVTEPDGKVQHHSYHSGEVRVCGNVVHLPKDN